MLYRLIFLTGNLKGQRITIDNEPMTIGRDADCSIKILDSEVASKHASLEHNALTGLRINDLGSMNKILVNNHEVREANLKHGDIIEVGRTRFLVQATVETDPTKNAPNRKRRHISLAPLMIIIPMLVIIYGVISFCQKIIREGSQANLTPVVVSLVDSNTLKTQTVLKTAKPDDKPPPQQQTNESLQPISDELRKMQEDLRGIRKTVNELAVKPPTAPTSNVNAQVVKPAEASNQAPPHNVQTVNTNGSVTNQKPSPPTAIVENTDPKIKITSLEPQKFKESEDFDEMRIITIGLQREWPVKNMDEDAVKVEISFYDQSADGKNIVPTRAITKPKQPMKPLPWVQNTQSAVTATYLVPKGSRKISPPNTSAEQFYGYVVRVYYGTTLQDEDARPKDLLNYSSGTLRKQNSPDNGNHTKNNSPKL